MKDNIFVDTNVLVYCRDTSEPGKQARAAEWIAYLWESGGGRLSLQVLSEYYAVVTAKLKPGLETAEAREDVDDLLAWQPLPMTFDLLVEAWANQDRFHLSWWDSLIVAAARFLQCKYLLSEDFQAGQDLQGIHIINPFLIRPGDL